MEPSLIGIGISNNWQEYVIE